MSVIKTSDFKEKLFAAFGLRKKYRVEGDSMNPLLYHGEYILVKKVKKYKVTDIVVSKHPIQSDIAIVKQVEAIDEKGRLKLVGINRLESSHRFGLIHLSKIMGKVTSKLD